MQCRHQVNSVGKKHADAVASTVESIRLSAQQANEEREKWMRAFARVEAATQAATATLESHAVQLARIDLAVQTDRTGERSLLAAISSGEQAQAGFQRRIDQLAANLAVNERVVSQLQAVIHGLHAKHDKLQRCHESLQDQLAQGKSRSQLPSSAGSSEPELSSGNQAGNSKPRPAASDRALALPSLTAGSDSLRASPALGGPRSNAAASGPATVSSPQKHVRFFDSEVGDEASSATGACSGMPGAIAESKGLPLDELGLLNWDVVPAGVRKAVRGLAVQLEVKRLSLETLTASLAKCSQGGYVDDSGFRNGIKGLGVHLSEQSARELFQFWDYMGLGRSSISDVAKTIMSVQSAGAHYNT
jgi:hypothetical protein